MAKKIGFKRVLWPIDVFAPDLQVFESSKNILKFLSAHGAKIQPIYVLVPGKLDMLAGPSSPEWMEAYREAAKEKLAVLKDTWKLDFCLPAKLVENPRGSLRSAVQSILDYAKDTNVDLIVVPSHARSGVSRMFLGSFAESVLLESRLPTLITSPHMEHPAKKIENILFATDFSKACARVYQRFLPFAGAAKAKVVLFHKATLGAEPYAASMAFSANVYLPPQSYFNDLKKMREKDAKRHIAQAAKLRIPVEYLVGNQLASVGDAVLIAAQANKVDLIVATAQSGALESLVVGSSVRAIVRASDVPVLVYPMESESKAKQHSKKIRKRVKPGKSPARRPEILRRIY